MELIEKELTEEVIGACFEVMNELGQGFLESVYQKALVIALTQLGITVAEQAPLKVTSRNIVVGDFYPDILVEDRLIIELKALKSLTSEHEAQLLNYLKASGLRVGMLINFGRQRLEWKRLVA